MALSDILSGVLGGSAGKDEMKQSIGLSREALEQLRNLKVPEIEIQKIALTNPELAGMLEAEQLGQSEMAGVSVDPRLKHAQMKALEELAGLSQTGLGVEDQAAFNQLRRQAGGEAQAAQQSILQNAAATGTLDSGNAMIAQLNAAQQQANRLSTGAEQQAAAAAEARRQALSQYANMSSNMSNQDFSQRSSIANAKDSINKFNAQNLQNVNQLNLGNKQAIANQTAANKNQQEIHNKGLIQQQFQNNLSKATGVAGQMNNVAGQYANQGQAAAQGQAAMNSALISGGLGIAGAYAGKK